MNFITTYPFRFLDLPPVLDGGRLYFFTTCNFVSSLLFQHAYDNFFLQMPELFSIRKSSVHANLMWP